MNHPFVSNFVFVILATILGIGFAKLVRIVVPKSRKKLEGAHETIAGVSARSECAFCGKPVRQDSRWNQKMHRAINSEIRSGWNQVTYENIEVRIPCCDQCRSSNHDAMRNVDKRAKVVAFSIASAIGAIVLFTLVSEASQREYTEKDGVVVLLGWLFAILIVFFLAFWGAERLFSMKIEGKIKQHPLVAALRKKGWKIGQPPGFSYPQPEQPIPKETVKILHELCPGLFQPGLFQEKEDGCGNHVGTAPHAGIPEESGHADKRESGSLQNDESGMSSIVGLEIGCGSAQAAIWRYGELRSCAFPDEVSTKFREFPNGGEILPDDCLAVASVLKSNFGNDMRGVVLTMPAHARFSERMKLNSVLKEAGLPVVQTMERVTAFAFGKLLSMGEQTSDSKCFVDRSGEIVQTCFADYENGVCEIVKYGKPEDSDHVHGLLGRTLHFGTPVEMPDNARGIRLGTALMASVVERRERRFLLLDVARVVVGILDSRKNIFPMTTGDETIPRNGIRTDFGAFKNPPDTDNPLQVGVIEEGRFSSFGENVTFLARISPDKLFSTVEYDSKRTIRIVFGNKETGKPVQALEVSVTQGSIRSFSTEELAGIIL